MPGMLRERRADAPAVDSAGGPASPSIGRIDPASTPATWPRSAAIYALVLLIVLADWLTPAGIVVGILLGVPILLSSAGDSRGEVLAVSVASTVGFVVAAVFGRGPIAPEAVWLPNRLFAVVTIAVSSILALILQRRRMDAEGARIDAEGARADAESARDLSRLLHSLMAHDLRSPLALARDTLGSIERPLRSGTPVDLELVAEVDARLRRSLRAIQLVLDSARGELTDPSERVARPRVDAGAEIRDEVAAFAEEAHRSAKELHCDLPAGSLARVDPAVLRQSVAILIDNAIRYAVPGPIRVSATVDERAVHVHVRDSGPGLSRRRAEGGSGSGEGLGLRLCALLAQRAGGALDVVRDADDGSELALRLPADR